MRKRILHLTGSAESQFFADLSLVYARDCIAYCADPQRFDFVIAYVRPDGRWVFPDDLSRGTLEASPAISFSDAMVTLQRLKIDLAVPQMFCQLGMTHYRAMLELLGISFVGNHPQTMAIAADKSLTRAVVSGGGVAVPEAILLHRRDGQPLEHLPLELPLVIKPTRADNSLGVTLVHDRSELPAAIRLAFEYSDEILVERFVPPGREVRCGVIEIDGELTCLPLEEYRLDPVEQPIRGYANKLMQNADGELDLTSKFEPQSWVVRADDPIVQGVWEAARTCHRALGCRHYSLFDFRIDPAGQPWFLEAGLYCSFAPKSILVGMMKADGVELAEFFSRMVAQVDVEPETAIATASL
jgi:D-alanine-D-alanine ligase